MDIQIPEFSKTYSPGDDFYQYINENWLKKAHIPDDETSYSVTEEIKDPIEKDLFSIIDTCKDIAIKGKPTTNKLKDTIGRLVLSSMRQNVQKNSIEFLKKTIRNIHCIRSINDVGEIMGYFCKNKIANVLSTYIQLERTKKNEAIYTLCISYGSMGLPDISYYSATGPGKIRTLHSYIETIRTVCKLLELDDVSDIINLESYFAANIEGIKTNESILIKGSELAKHKVPWESFFKSYGVTNWKSLNFRMQSFAWIRVLEKAFETVTFDQWKNLCILHLIIHALPILPPPYDNIHFDFFKNKLSGQKKKISQEDLTLELVKTYLTQPLSILYKKEFLKESMKKDATHFIEKIRDSAIDKIESNTWLYDETKKEAKQKIKHMVLSIGWPDAYPKLILPELQTDNLLLNIYLLSSASTAEDIALLNTKSKPGKYWNEPTFLVNAYYYNEINEFIVPAASLFYPFYGSKESIGWNYGGLGAVIGHEMVHAFDDDGQKYDVYGNYKSWWKARDVRRFDVLSKKLITLYNNSKILGRNVNGKLTLNENLADLGGLSIALDALKKELQGSSEKQRINELRKFFISYAVSWRTKIQKQKEIQNLFLDVHSHPELRVNNIVSQFQEWYDVFDVKVPAKLYVAPEDRIQVY